MLSVPTAEDGAADPGRTTPTRARPARVFLQDFVDVPRALEQMKPCLCDGDRWLAPLARQAEDDSATLLARIGAGWASGLLGREVRIALGGWRPRADGMVVSIRWEAAEGGRLFPVLDGDLELAPLGPEQCRVILAASYTPPFGPLGHVLDRALLHRLAESTARSFLVQLAAHLEHMGR